MPSLEFTNNGKGLKKMRQHFSNLQLSSFGDSVPTIASDSCSWLRGLETDVVFFCFNPSASRFHLFEF